jgi:hypothetical protein
MQTLHYCGHSTVLQSREGTSRVHLVYSIVAPVLTHAARYVCTREVWLHALKASCIYLARSPSKGATKAKLGLAAVTAKLHIHNRSVPSDSTLHCTAAGATANVAAATAAAATATTLQLMRPAATSLHHDFCFHLGYHIRWQPSSKSSSPVY